jgi:hypothetical protein
LLLGEELVYRNLSRGDNRMDHNSRDILGELTPISFRTSRSFSIAKFASYTLFAVITGTLAYVLYGPFGVAPGALAGCVLRLLIFERSE